MAVHIQMIRLESGSYMTLQEIMFNSSTSGKLKFCANPISLRREELFNIEGDMVVTESFHFPIPYLIQWLKENDSIDENNVIKNIGFLD